MSGPKRTLPRYTLRDVQSWCDDEDGEDGYLCWTPDEVAAGWALLPPEVQAGATGLDVARAWIAHARVPADDWRLMVVADGLESGAMRASEALRLALLMTPPHAPQWGLSMRAPTCCGSEWVRIWGEAEGALRTYVDQVTAWLEGS